MLPILLCLVSFLAVKNGETTPVKISTAPQQIYIEKGTPDQYLNFDFIVENLTEQSLLISSVEVSVLDDKGQLEFRKHLDASGFSPSILVIPNREIEPGKSILVFNPFHTFDSYLELKRLRYEFSFAEKGSKKEYTAEVFVTPVFYETKTNLVLPIKERILVNSGHDFYAHHRRFDFLHPIARRIGFTSNFMRFGYDFFVIDETGQKYKSQGATATDWFGFGVPIYAPGSGRVVAVSNTYPDDFGGHNLSIENIAADPMLFYGNNIVIDHLNGEYSMLAHLKQGSIKVKIGEMVKQGQLIAQIGTSGSAEQPHLHYELRTGSGFNVEGLPSYFRDFRRILGSNMMEIHKGRVDTGDLVKSN